MNKFIFKLFTLVLLMGSLACGGMPQSSGDNSNDTPQTAEEAGDNNSNNPDTSGESCDNAAITEVEAARTKLQSLDTFPLPQEFIDALDAGCNASPDNKEKFLEAFLCSLGIDPSLAGNPDIQDDIDNLEDIDLDNFPDTCA